MKLISLIIAFTLIFISPDFSDCQSNVQITKESALQYAKPKKPLKIKLHRNKNGEYSWDITGENVDEIIRADKRLRKLLFEEK